MPFKQIRTILPLETVAVDAGTRVVKLPLSNCIHSLAVYVKAKLGSSPSKTYSIYDHTDLIEVIANGSEVLFSMGPKEIHDLQKALLDKPIVHTASSSAGATVFSWFIIPFGFSLWDTHYWLPCAKFADLELRITYSPTIAADGFASGQTGFMVLAFMTMGIGTASPAGTLRHTIAFDYTTPQSGDTVIDLPRRWPIAGIQIFAEHPDTTLPNIISAIALSLNAGQVVPINIPTWALIDNTHLNNPMEKSVFIDLGEYENNQPLNPRAYDVVQLILTNAYPDATCRVILEEVMAV